MDATLAATALALAIAAGVSPYATVAVLGVAHRVGFLTELPGLLTPVTSPWVLALALLLTAVELGATLIPGLASAWEAVHLAVRPPAAALLSVLTLWGGEPLLILLVAFLAGGVATGTLLTKLGVRLAIDTSPEPLSNGVANTGELAFITAVVVFVFQHPVLVLGAAVLVVVALALVVRAVWGMLWTNVTRLRRPGGARHIRS
jgi:hypothetical protein